MNDLGRPLLDSSDNSFSRYMRAAVSRGENPEARARLPAKARVLTVIGLTKEMEIL